MFLFPSKILFCNSCGTVNDISLERDIMDLSAALYRGARWPKLQVVKKGGFYFALNDTKLKLYRHLEAIGQCGMVKVKKVRMREVPKGIRNLMQVPEKKPKSNKGKINLNEITRIGQKVLSQTFLLWLIDTISCCIIHYLKGLSL